MFSLISNRNILTNNKLTKSIVLSVSLIILLFGFNSSFGQLLISNSDNVSQFNQSIVNESFALRPNVNYNLNNYVSKFNNFQGVIDCNEFTQGNGSGLNFGLEFDTQLSDNIFLGLNFNYSDISAVFSRNNITYIRNNSTKLEEKVTTLAEIESKLNFVDFRPALKLNLAEFWNGPLFFTPAFRLSYALGGNFTQTEKISSPNSAVFTNNDGSQVTQRNLASGDFTTLNSLNFGAFVGLEKYFKVSETNYLTFNLGYDIGLNNILSDADWKINTFSVGLGYRYSINKSKEEPPVIKEEPPVIKEEPPVIKEEPIVEIPKPAPAPPNFDLEVTNEAVFAEVISGKEILATIPVVNSVFFEEGSSELIDRYKKEYANIDFFSGNAVEKHYYILPRIAKKLKENPNARLILRGYTSGKYSPSENKKLATERVEYVQKILNEMGISNNLIKVEIPAEPDIKSTLEGLDLAVENRRVDLILQNAPLQTYIEIVSFKEVTGSLKVKASIYNSEDKVTVKTNLSKKAYNLGNDEKLEILYKYRVDVNSDSLYANIDANLNNQYKNYSNTFELQKLKSKYIALNLENFEAVLRFDYNSSELSAENKELINQLHQMVPEGTTLVILGSTDTYGTERRNKTLAAERAAVTNAYIKTLKGRNINIETTTTEEKFDETTPQGRFLNRSIRLRLKP